MKLDMFGYQSNASIESEGRVIFTGALPVTQLCQKLKKAQSTDAIQWPGLILCSSQVLFPLHWLSDANTLKMANEHTDIFHQCDNPRSPRSRQWHFE